MKLVRFELMKLQGHCPRAEVRALLLFPALLQHGANADVLDNEYQVTPAD
jgi:hypothetical protein